MESLKFSFITVVCALLLSVQIAHSDSLDDIEKRIKDHAQKMLDKVEQKEQAVKSTIEKEYPNWDDKKNYTVGSKSIKGPEEHPWLEKGSPKGVNPNSKSDYKADSKNAWDTDNFTSETWSCFEPQLVAYGDCEHKIKGVTWDTADPELTAACWAHCCTQEFVAYLLYLANLNPPEHDAILGGGGHYYRNKGGSAQNGAGNNQDYYEIVQFWFPENQAAINNYGRMRVNPQDLTGEQKQKFLRQTLLQDKMKPEKQNNDNISKEYDDGYPMKKNKMKSEPDPDWRKDPIKGQYQARTGGANAIDHFAAHVYRTHISSQLSDDRPETKDGYKKEKKSWFDALELDTQKKYQLNIWTEYDYFDFLSTIDSASFSIKNDEKNRSQKFMKALLEKRDEYEKRADKKDPYYKSKGSIAYRVGKWSQFEPLKEVAEISEDTTDFLKEVVYFNGLELYPLSFTYEGFMIPELTLRTISARKAFEIAGNKELAKKFPGKQKSKMNTYTILNEDKSREVDKHQRVYPLNPDGKTQECARTQKAPNALQQTEDQWTEKQFPHDLMGYVKEDNTDSAHMYWNKRVMCNCRFDAETPHGSEVMNWVPDGLGPGRGDGDRIYGKFEKTLCTYKEKELPSAIAGEDRPQCDKPGYGQKKVYQGLQDDVSSKGHK